jgi:hypothetical protein
MRKRGAFKKFVERKSAAEARSSQFVEKLVCEKVPWLLPNPLKS